FRRCRPPVIRFELFSAAIALRQNWKESVSRDTLIDRAMIYPVRTAHMTPERFDRIRAVYEAAVDAPAASRQGVLDRECSGDDELRQEVERLLGAREHLPEWLSGPVLGVAHVALANGPSTLTQPAPVGHVHFPSGAVLAQRYRIIYLLGRGGMGEVYR